MLESLYDIIPRIPVMNTAIPTHIPIIPGIKKLSNVVSTVPIMIINKLITMWIIAENIKS